MRWFREAAEQEYPVAQYNMGIMYEEGRGVAKSKSEAIKWYRRAANHGYREAILRLQEIS